MEKTTLGRTGIAVSRLCFGALTIGPLQANLPVDEGAAVIAHALARGVNFIDTAQLYGTYPHIRRALELAGQPDAVICTKTYAWTRELAVEAVEEARRELDRDVIDLFLLHEQESIHTLRGHREALDYLLECREKGIIRGVGASMHHVAAVRGAIQLDLDVIHPLLNRTGIGIVDGSREEMEAAVRDAHDRNIGVFMMKPLGGGNLLKMAEECLRYALALPFVDSIAIGMQCAEEVEANLSFWGTGAFTPAQRAALESRTRRLHIEEWCEGCGSCVPVCGQRALSMEAGRAVCRHDSCLLCGYCAAACPAWAIKVV